MNKNLTADELAVLEKECPELADLIESLERLRYRSGRVYKTKHEQSIYTIARRFIDTVKSHNEAQDKIVEWYKCPKCGQPVPCSGYISPVGECLCGHWPLESEQDEKLDPLDYIAELAEKLEKAEKNVMEQAIGHGRARGHLRASVQNDLNHSPAFRKMVNEFLEEESP